MPESNRRGSRRVIADGTVADVRVVRSLDRVYGLDQEAIDAAKQWRFEASVKDGVAVPVMVTLEMTFEMSTPVPPNRPEKNPKSRSR